MEVFILAKENSRFESALDKESKHVLGRLKKDVDLLEGIIEVCEANEITAGTFQCIGSLSGIGYYKFEEKDDGTLHYSKPIILDRPAELLSGTGFIGLDEDDKLDIHYHGIYLDSNGTISGGHFLKGKNPTAVTIEFAIYPANNIYLKRKRDSIFNLPIFHFSERSS